MATYDPKTRSYTNVEIKGHIDSNERHVENETFQITTPYGTKAIVKVIHRKSQPGNPMGKYRYLVQYHGPVKEK